MKKINVAVIGTKFMGKAHSNAWLVASKFFDLPYTPVLKVACSRNIDKEAYSKNWGYSDVETDWRKVVTRSDVDIVDICTPTSTHYEIAMEAIAAGKHIFCEKPCALNSAQAKEMAQAADKAGVLHYLNHNYRRIPAVVYAKQLVDEGKIGEIYHWRSAYLQDWIIDPDLPFTWQLNKEISGAGAHYDLNSHAIDLARYIVGEISSVSTMLKTFVTKRPIPGSVSGETGNVTVDDAAFMLAEFENGAIGSFDASRFAGGRKNYNYFELYGSKGSLIFNVERMNELQYLNLEDPVEQQGFKTIQVTESSHPYMSAWWAPGHIIGYEHTFTHAVKDFLEALNNGSKIMPNLWDGVKIMQVLEAGLLSSEQGRKIHVNVIK